MEWGYITPSGNFHISPQFPEASEFNGERGWVDKRWGYIDRTETFKIM